MLGPSAPVAMAPGDRGGGLLADDAFRAPDLRSQGDVDYFEDGAEIVLHGLVAARELNGQTASVIGFCNVNIRYRVRVHSTEAVKVVSKTNMKLQTAEPMTLIALAAERA